MSNTPTIRSGKPRILFVDDENNILQGIRRMLFDCQDRWELDFADSGEAALKRFGHCPYDFIVSDMRMPVMDGAELLTAFGMSTRILSDWFCQDKVIAIKS